MPDPSYDSNCNINNQIQNNKKIEEKGGCPLPMYSDTPQRNFLDNKVSKKYTYEVNPFNFIN